MAAIEELSTDLDRAEIIAGVEAAAALAASESAGRTLGARLDLETGVLSCFASRRVVAEVRDPEHEIQLDLAPEGAGDGDVVEIPVPFGSALRRASRAARESLELRLRSGRLLSRAERFRDRVGKLETGRVLRREGHDLIVDLGPVEGRLPAGEQSRHEVFNPGDTVRAAIRSIEPEDPPVILTRIAPDVVAGVIERETPEVRRGVVAVRAVARHPGTRAKVAVWSDTPGVDPVAACLGPGGSRIRAVSRELRGERVDVVRWSESVEGLTRNALRPAEVLRVERSGGDGRERGRRRDGVVVTVSEAQLPRAVGKRGENVRLASELVGATIKVVAEGQEPHQRPGRGRGRGPGAGFRERREGRGGPRRPGGGPPRSRRPGDGAPGGRPGRGGPRFRGPGPRRPPAGGAAGRGRPRPERGKPRVDPVRSPDSASPDALAGSGAAPEPGPGGGER